jgi:uncharacterized protein
MPITPIQIVQDAYAAFGRGDVPKVLSLLSPDVEIVQSEEMPWGGCFRGHEGATHFLTTLTSHITSTVDVERTINSGAHVSVIGWTRGIVKSTGAGFSVPIVHVWHVRDGLVNRIQFFIDHPTMLKALSAQQAKFEQETLKPHRRS